MSLRPLAPKDPNNPSPDRVPPKKRKVSSACEACKIAKTKCSGHQPCTYCVKKNIECIMDPESDQRRKVQMRRRLNSLEEDQDLFVRLVRTLRHTNQAVDGLLKYIRDDQPSVAEIKSFMDCNLPQREFEKTPELLDIYNGLNTTQQGVSKSWARALDIPRLCDRPRFSGRARPWTTITDDDDFVSHLISLWFTWHHLFFNWVDRDLFLRDLNSGNVQSTFCSPFLVNTILAEACFYSDYPEACAVPGDLTTKGEHFWKEAKRLLDAEEGKITLATVQGLGLMYSCSSVMGKDRLGWTYMVRASKAVPILRSSPDQIFRDSNLTGEAISQLLDHLEVGMFGSMVLGCLSLQKIPPMDKPIGIQLPIHQKDEGEWFPYPRQVDPVPAAHTHCAIMQRSLVEVSVNDCYDRLVRWKKDLPECLWYTSESVPEVLSLHMNYHTLITIAFAFLKTPILGADQKTLLSVSCARQKCIQSAQAVSESVTIHQSQWGIDRGAANDMQYICTALFMLVDDLDDEKSHDAFLNLAKSAVSFGGRWLLTKGMFRLVQIATVQANKSLSPEIVDVFKRFERRLWKSEDRQRFRSAYPNFAAVLRQQDDTVPDDLEMDQFLEVWSDFTMDGQREVESSAGKE
ncbi:hypothetical protein FE257_000062 [Aspergillus nanangensis]|uniref:Zn(2)-C6 fungal-type domain-containing protein n=1 Tax=Aspergillus nanangensis TaxID=2582783 RepID=A0AAD4CYN8_ASPNN|nr:hypothetical protein FE257_000062 [Aspergillus nanangensis]